jgi:hypothetical protein
VRRRNSRAAPELFCWPSSARTKCMAQPFRFGEVAASASFNAVAHWSQQTSTVCPPIVTLMALESSSQSQAAQVFAVMVRSP